jgi:hypothetical protein
MLRRVALPVGVDLRCVPVLGELFDIVDQAEELPLPIDFGLSAQREAIEPLVVSHVRKHRLHRRKALPVTCPTRRRINALFHPGRMRLGRRRGPAAEKGDLAHGGLVGGA